MNSKQSIISLSLAIILTSSLVVYSRSVVEPALTQIQPEIRAQLISLSLQESGFVVAPHTSEENVSSAIGSTSLTTNPFLEF